MPKTLSSKFVEVVVPSSFPTVEIRLPDGVVIQVPPGTDPAWLQRVLAAIEDR